MILLRVLGSLEALGEWFQGSFLQYNGNCCRDVRFRSTWVQNEYVRGAVLLSLECMLRAVSGTIPPAWFKCKRVLWTQDREVVLHFIRCLVDFYQFLLPFKNWWTWAHEIRGNRLSIGKRIRRKISKTFVLTCFVHPVVQIERLINLCKKNFNIYSQYCTTFHVCLFMFPIKVRNYKQSLWAL